MVAVVAGLLEVTVIGVAPVRVRRPPEVTVGVAVPIVNVVCDDALA